VVMAAVMMLLLRRRQLLLLLLVLRTEAVHTVFVVEVLRSVPRARFHVDFYAQPATRRRGGVRYSPYV